MAVKQAAEVAIIGYACRMPGASNSSSLWRLLKENRCSVTWVTPDRFSTQDYYHPAADQRGRSYTFAAGLIDDVWGFDAIAFGMSPREAEQVDPQHRHLLEVAYDAVAHAGLRPSDMAGSDVGVYIGASSVDHGTRFIADPAVADMHMMTGNSLSILANRISYSLDLRGPSVAIDTACSSSLVALHLAAEAIRNGTIDTAIVGGVNLILSPFMYVGFSRASMLSPTGLCRPFDAAADGYVRAEGAAVVVLRSMTAAYKGRNHIRGVVVGSGINQDGRTTGLSLPSAESQSQLLGRVYSDFAVDPSDLLFVEAHGTGTRVGDPLEAHALGTGLAQRRAQPLPIGSIKSNVGHLEPVSGLAGLLKTLLAFENGLLPATLHQKSPNPDIKFDELNLKVVGSNTPLDARPGAMLAGINSFGFGGTNAHAIVRADKSVERMVQLPSSWTPPLVLSAHTPEALSALAHRYDDQWPEAARASREFIGASAYLRDLLPHRVLFHGTDANEIRLGVRAFASGGKPPSMISGQALGNNLPLAFVFSGNGSQWAGMGRVAWDTNEVFREALRDVDSHFAKVQKWSIIDALFADNLGDRLRRATYSQPMLLALQVATVRALEAAGIVPSATVGHSVGEIAAAWAAGALSLEQAIDVVKARSRHQEAAYGAGGMAALMLSEREARRFLTSIQADGVDVAAVNSWRSVTISGVTSELRRVLDAAEKARISARGLEVEYPFHSPLIDSVRGPLLRELENLKSLAPRCKFVSSVTGDILGSESLDAEHWWRNVREPVQFDAALNTLLKNEFRIFVEVGPKPILASYVRDVARETGTRIALVETLHENDTGEAGDPLRRCAARIVVSGGNVNPQRFFGQPPGSAIDLPLYPWQHSSFHIGRTSAGATFLDAPAHPLLGRRPRVDSTEWFSTIDPQLFPWLEDHKVGDAAVFPATAYVEIVLAAAKEMYGDVALELRDFDILQPLFFDSRTSFDSLARCSSETGLIELLFRPRDGISEWALHARGIISQSPIDSKKKTIPGAGPVVVLQPKIYEISQTLGLGYGPSFQRLERVTFPHPKVAVGILKCDAPLPPAPYVTDLTAFDSGFHALFASEEAGVADMPMKRMLPVRLGRVRVYKQGAVATSLTARTVRQSPNSILMDIDLFDAAGDLALSAESVRLVEAPPEAAADPRSLSYRTTDWRHDRPGRDSRLKIPGAPGKNKGHAPSPLNEALLLVEAGCLQAAWKALSARGGADGSLGSLNDPAPATSRDNSTDETPAQRDWQPFYRNALFWYLEGKGLAIERAGTQVLSNTCDLPDLGSIVKSLVVRHPSMIAEITSLARIDEFLGKVIAGEKEAANEFSSSHWRHLGASARQGQLLRQEALGRLDELLSAAGPDRLIFGLMVGAEHIDAACSLVGRYSNLELTVTDADTARVEEARLAIGDNFPRIHCVSWQAATEIQPESLDFCAAIDGLAEVAATGESLAAIRRVLRPKAPLVAGELCPSLFWDIARGTRPTWWKRSANVEFPVGALLTAQEWTDELREAGFEAISVGHMANEANFGVIIGAVASSLTIAPKSLPVFSWEGHFESDGQFSASLRARSLTSTAVSQADDSGRDEVQAVVTDVVWGIEASFGPDKIATMLAFHLQALAERLRVAGEQPARLWVVVHFRDSGKPALQRPEWCAIASALRVAQNEHPAIEIRCIGVVGESAELQEALMAELLRPDLEREIFLEAGQRTIFRLRRGIIDTMASPVGPEETIALESGRGSARQKLTWTSSPRTAPGVEQIEIEVAAAGLNFRDVMWNLRLLPEEALEDGFSGPGLGMECAGVVARVGEGVWQFKPGDRVVAFARQAFRRHVVTPAFSAVKIPDGLSFEAASSIPVAFLTAYYSLVHLGKLSANETVLIHGGAGAVGLAATQIARRLGARIIASAGSEEKRALLRQMGVDFVCNSRSLSFADEIRELTQGKGVDLVLNSLAGEAMIRSVDCVRPFGRFIELGKRDFYSNTHLGLRPMRRNLTYFGVDIDQLIVEHKDLAQRLFAEVLGLFKLEELSPLPYRAFAGEFVNDAFHLMQRSGHVGKVIVTPPTQPSDTGQATGQFPVDSDGVHIVLGGTRGFGLATAEWLASRGARRLVLASRSGELAEGDLPKVDALRDQGVEVTIKPVDVTNEASLKQLIRQSGAKAPIKGIVHAAMVLDDRLMANHDLSSITQVLEPKVLGALNLQSIVGELKLDYLLLYSSFTTVFGNPGQYNYVAANAYLEGVARRLRSHGVPAAAVSWGAIEDAGYLARNIVADTNLKKRFSSSLMPAQLALDSLDWLCDDAGNFVAASCAIARIDWTTARRDLVALRTPCFSGIAVASGGQQNEEAAALLQRLRSLPVDEVVEQLADIVVVEIARVLRLSPKEVDRHRPLAEIGMDSLMMLELRTTVEASLQIDLPMMSLSSGITPVDVARRIAPLVAGTEQQAVSGTIAAVASSHFVADIESVTQEVQQAAVSAVLGRVQEMKRQ